MKRETLYFGCLPSSLLASSCVLFLEYSLAVIKTGCFRFLMWTEDQQLSRNLAGLQDQIGIITLVDQVLDSWPLQCETAIVELPRLHPVSILINLPLIYVGIQSTLIPQRTWLIQPSRGCRIPPLPLFLYTLACEVSGLYFAPKQGYAVSWIATFKTMMQNKFYLLIS